jgi:hypothetical protein
MRLSLRSFATLLSLLVSSGCATVHIAGRRDESPRVLQAEARLAQAVLANAVDSVDMLLTDGYTYTLPDGKIITKARYLADLRAWWRPLVVEHSQQQVRVMLDGRAAIITGVARYLWQAKDQPPEEAREQYTDMYVLGTDGQWRRAASHASCLAGRCT